MPKLTIRQWPLATELRGRTILDAALQAGVPYPHGCRTGECGACKTQLLSGDVSMEAYDEAALSASERDAGLILACRARSRGDVQVAWLGEEASAELPVLRLRAQVTNVEAVTPSIRRIYAWPERRLRFAAGQFARIRFGDLPARSYSMANHPDEEALEFHIRLMPDGAASTYIEQRLRVGDYIRIEGPFGRAHLQPGQAGPIVAVAGGTGLAPIKSIVRTALRAEPKRAVRLYVGARDEADVYDEGELTSLASLHADCQVRFILSAPGGQANRRAGTLPELLARDFPLPDGARLYVAGPSGMVEAVTSLAIAKGFPSDCIHSDPFLASGDPPATPKSDSFPRRLLRILWRRNVVAVTGI
jgi:CDP-4-dehydro-6-deoxyglucose reductase/ferredoxin-NAD(P)+ reductase (naphthalene dioxygenase ferredoxin-specific)